MVYEVVEYHAYRVGQDLRKNKASTTEGVQKNKVRVGVHHITEGY